MRRELVTPSTRTSMSNSSLSLCAPEPPKSLYSCNTHSYEAVCRRVKVGQLNTDVIRDGQFTKCSLSERAGLQQPE